MLKNYKPYSRFYLALAFLCGLLLLAVWPYGQLTEPHDAQRLMSSILIALLLPVCLWFNKLSYRLLLLLCGVYSWGMLMVWLSPMPFWSSLEFAMLFSVVLLSSSLMPKVDAHILKHLAVVFVIVQAFYLTHNLTYYTAIILSGSTMVPYDLATGFSNIRFYAQFLIWTVPFILAILTIYPKLVYRNAIVAVLMFGWAYQFLTGTRAFMLALAITIPAVWLFTRADKLLWKQYTKWLLISAIGGFIIYLLMLFAIPSLFCVNVDLALHASAKRSMLNSSGRVYLWQEALRLIYEHPWVGAGPMMTAMLVDINTSAHPHNFVLQLLAEWGIPFTCALLIFMIFGIIRWKKLIDSNIIERAPIALPIVASLSAGITAGLVDGLIVMPVSLVYMTIIIGLLAGLWRTWTPIDERMSFPKWLIPVFVLPGIYVAAYAISMWPERNVADEYKKQIIGNGYRIIQDNYPRFWVVGHIVLEKSDSKK
jgi:putative inorganic carbon (hco3(-)) transporter